MLDRVLGPILYHFRYLYPCHRPITDEVPIPALGFGLGCVICSGQGYGAGRDNILVSGLALKRPHTFSHLSSCASLSP